MAADLLELNQVTEWLKGRKLISYTVEVSYFDLHINPLALDGTRARWCVIDPVASADLVSRSLSLLRAALADFARAGTDRP